MITIRPMTPDDADAVLAIYRQGIEEGTATFLRDCPTWDAFSASHLPVCRFVSVEDGRVTGWLALSPISARPHYRGVAEVSVYVDRAYRRKGAGYALLRATIEASEAAGIWTLQAHILAGNTASRKLHEDAGFRVVGYRERIAQDRFGSWHDTLLMERRSAL